MYCFRRIFFILLAIVCVTRASAQSVIEFKPEIFGNYLGKQLFTFEDSSTNLTIHDVVAHPERFKVAQNDVPNLGLTKDNNWVRFNIINNTRENKITINYSYPIAQDICLYVVRGGLIDSSCVAEVMPVSEREYKHQFYIFDVPLAPGEEITCYFKIYSTRQLMVPVTVGTTTNVIRAISTNDLLSGLYFGIMLVMLLYNFFVYMSVRDKTYLVYVNYIFWVTLTQATLLGYGHRFLWTDSAWLTSNMVCIAGALVGISSVLFVKSFLHTRRNARKLHPFLNLIILGDLIGLGLLLAGNPIASYNAINATAGLGGIFVLFVSFRVLRKGYGPARFFILSWGTFMLSVIIWVLKDANVLPYNLFTYHALEIGSAIEAILLSLALADSINILKKEKEHSQAEALRISRENERIIREQNVILESKVNERTVELKASNAELNKTLVELKEAEAQLVESEKMASLGQLTAGIAHEINNPINFVTSNVHPLKRDVEILLGAVQTIEEVGLENGDIAEKQEKIKKFKTDIDFDYLKVEIEHLLNGINEGAARTAEIVKGLRVFSRLDEDDLKQADMNEGIDSTLIIVNNMLNAAKIKVTKEYGAIPVIECYPGKLNQVFMNVITNAMHAIEGKFKGQPGGELKIITTHDEKNVYINFKDNGTGMTDETRKKLFEPFFTTKEVGSGTGLGLSISWNTIKKHNGNIVVNSTLGEGSEFILEIPIIHQI
jgi:two-component system NtrC family sensor kinase